MLLSDLLGLPIILCSILKWMLPYDPNCNWMKQRHAAALNYT